MTETYKVINYYDLFPNKKPNTKKKNMKSKYFRKMRVIYEQGVDKYDFKRSCAFKNDPIILMYVDDKIIGYVFIKEENIDFKQGLNDPFFYNFVIDPKEQNSGYGTKLFDHMKQQYKNQALYCLVESSNKKLHEWYDRREGIVYNDYKLEWPDGYFLYKFPNGTVHVDPEPAPIDDTPIEEIPDLDPTVGDDLMGELDDLCD
jgi:hypothetical protein